MTIIYLINHSTSKLFNEVCNLSQADSISLNFRRPPPPDKVLVKNRYNLAVIFFAPDHPGYGHSKGAPSHLY